MERAYSQQRREGSTTVTHTKSLSLQSPLGSFPFTPGRIETKTPCHGPSQSDSPAFPPYLHPFHPMLFSAPSPCFTFCLCWRCAFISPSQLFLSTGPPLPHQSWGLHPCVRNSPNAPPHPASSPFLSLHPPATLLLPPSWGCSFSENRTPPFCHHSGPSESSILGCHLESSPCEVPGHWGTTS